MTEKATHHEWVVTHTGWMLLSPVYIQFLDGGGCVPIARGVPHWWLDVNLWIQDWVVNLLLSIFAPEAMGYSFHHVRELVEPFTIRIKAEDPA